MRIACPVEEGNMIAKAFGKAEAFILFDTEEEEILSQEKVVIPADDAPSYLSGRDVDTLICGTLSAFHLISLAQKDIEIVGGAGGNARSAVLRFLAGTLETDDMTLEGCGGSCSGNCSSCQI